MQTTRTRAPRKLNPTLLDYDVQSSIQSFNEDDPSLNTVTLHTSFSGDSGMRRSGGFGMPNATYNMMQNSPMLPHVYSDDDILGQPVDQSMSDSFVSHNESSLTYGLGEELGDYPGMMEPSFPPIKLEFDDDEQQQQQQRQTGLLERFVESQSPSAINATKFSGCVKQGQVFSPVVRHISVISSSAKDDSPFSAASKNSSPFVAPPRNSPFDSGRYAVTRVSAGLRQNYVPNRQSSIITVRAAGVPASVGRPMRSNLPTLINARSHYSRGALLTQSFPTPYSNSNSIKSLALTQPVISGRPVWRRGRGTSRGVSALQARKQAQNMSRLMDAQRDAHDSLRNLGIIVHEESVNHVEAAVGEVLIGVDGQEGPKTEPPDQEIAEVKYPVALPNRGAPIRGAFKTKRGRGSASKVRSKPSRFANADELKDDDVDGYVLRDEEEEDGDDLSIGNEEDDDAYSPNKRAPAKRGRKTGTKRRKKMKQSASAKRARTSAAGWLGGAIKGDLNDEFARPNSRSPEARPNLKVSAKSRLSLPATRGAHSGSSNASKSLLQDSKSNEEHPGSSKWHSNSLENAEDDSTRAGAYHVDADWRCVICDRFAADIVGRKNYCVAPERYRLIYYGVPTCKGCQVFFRKTLMELKIKGQPYTTLPCANGGNCTLLAGVGFCVACRFNRCVNNFPPPDALKPQRTPEGEIAKMVREKPVLHKVAPDDKSDDKPGTSGDGDGDSESGDDESLNGDAESCSSDVRLNGSKSESSGHSRNADDSHDTEIQAEGDGTDTLLGSDSIDEDSRMDTSADDCIVRIVEVAGKPKPSKPPQFSSPNKLANANVGAAVKDCIQ